MTENAQKRPEKAIKPDMIDEWAEFQKEPDFDLLIQKYGESTYNEIMNPLKMQKKLFGAEKKLIPPKQPMLLLQMKNGRTKFFDNVTQGVFKYEGSDGQKKKLWLNKKFLSDMEWGQHSVRYYNCTEDSFIPNGLTSTKLEYYELQKIIDYERLNYQELAKEDWEGKQNTIMTVAKSIGLILLAIAAIIIATKLLTGINLLDYMSGAADTAVQATATNITQSVQPPVTPATVP